MHSNNLRWSTVATLSVVLGGCSLAPDYHRPASPVAMQWSDASQQKTGTAVVDADALNWQAFIIDPQLRRAVTAALDNNRSLRQALLDIDAARAQYRIQRADRVPSLNATASGNRQRLPGDLSTTNNPQVNSTYQVGLGMSEFELDLFGRVRNLSDAALEQYLATAEATRGTQIALVAEVTQAYLTRDGAQRRLALTRQTLETRKASLELITQRRKAGTATALDYQEALGLTEQARADLESTDRQLRQAGHTLQLLIGTQDAESYLPATPQDELLLVQDIEPGTSSTLIERRPDILASEHRLKARNADIGAARAAFFPRLSLTGSFGSSSKELSGLFDGGSNAWTFAPSLSLPIFAGGRNRAGLDLAKVRKDSAVANYEDTIQSAFREVADSLAATDTLRREEVARQALADSSQEALKLAKARYEGGVDTHLRYLDAQRSAFSDQSTLIQVSTERQIALTNLFKSLGGGWRADAAGNSGN
ncbi:RND efflux system, outer membrane lipoprotein, NodT family [Pseudomonas sp. GM41(2012)]|uniref:efflux transporter outer membrane subunit n=1 Tax=Pseudomonas sp. (strain GM41(2012)) TaxID=1144708 RepID=UPI0002702233|nr:efflux transporter outer membrane subunit [Pseudomonas sp. GM41(2012)]EUB74184.1 RND efflux system, outer membrane lipoprotein, NodT family [Pseudomonas sp. GM41(2012)]